MQDLWRPQDLFKTPSVLQFQWGNMMTTTNRGIWDDMAGPYFQTKANKEYCIKLLAEMLWCRLDCLQVKHLQRPESIHMPYSVGGQNSCFSVRKIGLLLSMAGFCCRLLHAIRQVSPSCALSQYLPFVSVEEPVLTKSRGVSKALAQELQTLLKQAPICFSDSFVIAGFS